MNPLTGAVGALPLGSTAYPLPPGARFVSLAGNDAASGTVSEPFRTVRHAVSVGPPGSTIILRGGVYREMVEVPATKPLTIQAFPKETVWFSGSDVVGDWVADQAVWRRDGWTVRFDHDNLDPTILKGADSMAGHPDMVFVDGRPLRQVGSRAEVAAGTFFVDESTSQLFIGDNPQGHVVEAAVLPEALDVQASGSVIRGIGFMHYATSISHGGAVRGWNGVTFENDWFRENAASGLTLRGAATVRHVTSTFNGQLGIHGHLAHGARIEDSVTSGNNTSHFNPEYAAGGVKLTMSANVTLRGNVADDNYGHGLWLDEESNHATIVRNLTRRNARGAGIMFELSEDAVIAGNISTDNEAGLQAGEASHVRVWNNTLINNQYAFRAIEDARAPQSVDITIRNNILAAGRASEGPMLVSLDLTGSRSWQDMAWSSDFNAFYRPCTAVTTEIASLANGPGPPLAYESVDDEQAANAQERHSISVDDTAADPFVKNAVAGHYGPARGSRAKGTGTALPPDIAVALGLRADATVDRGAPTG